MWKKLLLFSFFLFSTLNICIGQIFIKTTDLFPERLEKQGSGTMRIIQDPAIDTLLSRYILSNKNNTEPNGYRVVIYMGRERNARDEAKRIQSEFMVLYPNIPSYLDFQLPNTFTVKVGNFRNKTEGTKLFLQLDKKYPNAFLGPTFIDFST